MQGSRGSASRHHALFKGVQPGIGAAMPMLAQGPGAGQAQVHALRPPSRPCAPKAVPKVKGQQKGKGRKRARAKRVGRVTGGLARRCNMLRCNLQL